jgi:hypothetical protein
VLVFVCLGCGGCWVVGGWFVVLCVLRVGCWLLFFPLFERLDAWSEVGRIVPAGDRWLHTAFRARATTDPRVGRLVKSHCFEPIDSRNS